MKNTYIARASILINAPAPKVWQGLTQPSLIKQYLFGTEVTTDWQVGSPITYKGVWQGKAYEDKGKILQLEPNKLLVSTFWSALAGLPDIPENYNTVRYELSDEGKATRVTIIQDNNATQEDADHSSQNWDLVLGGLKKFAGERRHTVKNELRTIIWQQLGAAIDMLENVLRACPDELWSESLWKSEAQPVGSSEFWYIAYHTLFWLDLYLTGAVEGFAPPDPFTLDELDPAGLLPERRYTKMELLSYLEYGRQKGRAAVEALTDERALQLCRFSWGETPFAGLLLDNMRHVQEHTAQLNLYLGQRIGWDPGWVAKTKSELFGG